MFKKMVNNKYSDDNWGEAINGTDNEFILRINSIAALTAGEATEAEINKALETDEHTHIDIYLDQIKFLQFKNSANNTYLNTISQKSIAGGNLGNQTCDGRVIFRDTYESVFEYIKKTIFVNGYKAMKEAIGTGLYGNNGLGETEEDIYGAGFNDLLDESDITSDGLQFSYSENQLSALDVHQLPDFDIIVISKTNSGKIKAKMIVKNVKFISQGKADTSESLEANTISLFSASKCTGWLPANTEVVD